MSKPTELPFHIVVQAYTTDRAVAGSQLCCAVDNYLREFGVKLSVIAAPLREASLAAKRGFGVGLARLSLRSNATFLGIPCVSPQPARI